MNILYRSLFDGLSVFGRRLSILAFHRVLPERDPSRAFDLDAGAFREQMSWVAGVFRVLPLEEAVDRLQRDDLPPRALCITFDDGYRDNLTVATPILKALGLHATFFLTTAYQDGSMMWNDLIIEAIHQWPGGTLDLRHAGLGVYDVGSGRQREMVLPKVIQHFKYLPSDERQAGAEELFKASGAANARLMMNAAEIAALHKEGMGIGGHTHSHPILCRLTPGEAQAEIRQNKATLEAITGSPVTLFAYPNGKPGLDFDLIHVRMVQDAGYKAAVTSAWGTAAAKMDIFQLPRFTPWDNVKSKYVLRLAQNYFRQGDVVSEESARVRF